MAKITIVHLLLVVATARQWPLHQLDGTNTFLHGDLSEEDYMALRLVFLLYLSMFVSYVELSTGSNRLIEPDLSGLQCGSCLWLHRELP